MARSSIIIFSFAVFIFACVMQDATAIFDIVDYIKERIEKLIAKEHLTCSNYSEYCEKSGTEFHKNDGGNNLTSSSMAIELCKVMLNAHLCVNQQQ